MSYLPISRVFTGLRFNVLLTHHFSAADSEYANYTGTWPFLNMFDSHIASIRNLCSHAIPLNMN